MFNIAIDGGRMTCTFPERMDTLACEKYQAQIDQQVTQAPMPVTFDMNGVAYVASSFLRICLKTAQALAKGQFELVNVGPEVKKVFKIAGLDRDLTIR
jgi:anti-anti-sigma factor